MIKFDTKKKSKTGGQIVRSGKETLTVMEFIQLYEKFIRDKALEGLSLRTMRDHKIHFNWFVSWIESPAVYSITDRLDGDVLKGYLHYMVHDKGLANCTVNIRLRTLKCYLKWLYDNEYTEVNHSIKLKLLKVADDKVQPVSKEDVQKVLMAIDTSSYAGFRDSVIIICILDTGIRISELLNTVAKDVDVKNHILKVRAEVSKTRSERLLPLSNKTVTLLKRSMEVSKDNGSDYLFLSSYSLKSINESNILKNFKRYAKHAGVKDLTPYKLRHTFAVEAVKRNMDIFTLQRIMGHNNITTTRQYIQLDTTDIKKKHGQASVLDSLLMGMI